MGRASKLYWRHWLPDTPIEGVADGNYSTIDLGLRCQREQVTVLTPVRLAANLFAPPPPRRPGQLGRPRIKGTALPKLAQVAQERATALPPI